MELFFHWLEKLFIKQIPPQRPVMLLYDGHSSHFTPEAISVAAKEGVILFWFCLPPNTTHAAHWTSASSNPECHKFLADRPGV